VNVTGFLSENGKEKEPRPLPTDEKGNNTPQIVSNKKEGSLTLEGGKGDFFYLKGRKGEGVIKNGKTARARAPCLER